MAQNICCQCKNFALVLNIKHLPVGLSADTLGGLTSLLVDGLAESSSSELSNNILLVSLFRFGGMSATSASVPMSDAF